MDPKRIVTEIRLEKDVAEALWLAAGDGPFAATELANRIIRETLTGSSERPLPTDPEAED